MGGRKMCLTVLKRFSVTFLEEDPSPQDITETLEATFGDVLKDNNLDMEGHFGTITVLEEPVALYARISGFYYAIRVVEKAVDPETNLPVWLCEVTRQIWE